MKKNELEELRTECKKASDKAWNYYDKTRETALAEGRVTVEYDHTSGFTKEEPELNETEKATYELLRATSEELHNELYKAERTYAKECRESKLQEEAERAGLTVDEYKAEQKRKKNIKKITKEIAELEKELAQKKAILANLKK